MGKLLQNSTDKNGKLSRGLNARRGQCGKFHIEPEAVLRPTTLFAVCLLLPMDILSRFVQCSSPRQYLFAQIGILQYRISIIIWDCWTSIVAWVKIVDLRPQILASCKLQVICLQISFCSVAARLLSFLRRSVRQRELQIVDNSGWHWLRIPAPVCNLYSL